MALDLDSLVFKVDTKPLEDAVRLVDDLGKSIGNLNVEAKKQTTTTTENVKQEKELAKARRDLAQMTEKQERAEAKLAKAREELANATEGEVKAKKKAVQAAEEEVQSLSAVEKVLARVADKTEILRSGSIELSDGILTLGRAYTASQANQLSNLKLLGATADQIRTLAKEYRDFNAFTGVNTFDKSASGLEKLKNDFKELTVVNELMAKGWNLTIDQIKGLGRDMIALEQTMSKLGATEAEVAAETAKLQQKTVAYANDLNKAVAASKEAEKAAKEQAAAIVKAEQEKANAINQSVKAIESSYDNWMQKTKAAGFVQEELSKQNRDYYKELQAQDEAANRERKQSFDNKVNLHNLYQQQEQANYQQDMQAMREYYKEQERISAAGEAALASIRNRQQKLQLTSEYTTQYGTGRAVSGAAADMKMQGVDDAVIKSYIEQAKAIEVAEKAARQKQRAIESVAAAEEKADSILRSLNMDQAHHANLNERSAATVATYERNLRLAGVTGEEAARKLAKFRTAQEQLNEASKQREMQYLSRAMGVQLGDVGVSLASGMNPITVMIQQGDQIRGLIQQVNADAGEMKTVMATAVSQMAGSFKLLGTAVSSFVLGGLETMGSSLSNLALNIIPGARNQIASWMAALELSGKSSEGLLKTFNILAGGLVASMIASVGALTVAWYQSTKEQDALAKQLALTGTAMGISVDSALALKNELRDLGVTGGTTTDVILAMSKAGGFLASEVEMVVVAANNMKKYAGTDIEETVKQYAKLKDDPVKALTELAKSTGMVSAETVNAIRNLVEQGEVTKATADAMKVLAEVHNSQVESMKATYSGFRLFIIGMWDSLAQFWDKVFAKTFDSDFAKNKLSELKKKLKDLESDSVDTSGFNDWEINKVKEQIAGLEKSLNVNTKLTEEQRKQLSLDEEAAKLREKNRTAEEIYLKKTTDLQRKISESNNPETAAAFYTEMQKVAQEYFDAVSKGIEKTGRERKNSDNEAEKARKAALKELQREAKLREEIWKNATAMREAFNKIDLDNSKEAANLRTRKIEIDNARELLGLTGEELEQRKRLNYITVENAKIDNKYATQRLALQKEYNEQLEKTTMEDFAELTARYNQAVKDMATNELFERQLVNEKVANDAAEKYFNAFKRYSDSITDVIYTALTEGGKAASKKLRDLIQAELKKPIVAVIQGVVNSVMGSAASTMGLGPQAQPGGFGGFGSFSTSNSSFGSSIGNLLGQYGNQNLAAIGTGMGLSASQAAAAANAYNSAAGNAFFAGNDAAAASYSQTASGLQQGSTIGQYANTAGSVLGYGQSLYSLSDGQYGQAAGQAIGTYFGGPIGTYIGGQLGSMVDSFFGGGGGPKVEGAAVMNLSGVQSVTGKQGGEQAIQQFASGYVATLNSVMKSLNAKLSDDIASFKLSYDYDVQGDAPDSIIAEIFDKSGASLFGSAINKDKGQYAQGLEEQAARLTIAVLKMSELNDNIKNVVDSVDPATASFQDLNAAIINIQSIQMLTSVFETLGFSADNASASLVEAMGGLQNAQSLLSSYYDNFYSESEKSAALTTKLSKEFEKLNLEMPASASAFRQLVESLDLTTSAGQETFATLMGLQGAFVQVAGTIRETEASERSQRLAYQREQEAKAAEELAARVEEYKAGEEAFKTLSETLMQAGNAAGFLALQTERAYADPLAKGLPQWTASTTAAGFNFQYAGMQAQLAKQASEKFSANALSIQNVGPALSSLSVENFTGQYSPLVSPIYVEMRSAIASAAGDIGDVIRDAVDGAALYAAQAQVRGTYQAGGVGLTSIYAAQSNVGMASQAGYANGQWQYGADVIAYGKALDNLNGALKSGKIQAEQFDIALAELNGLLPNAVELLNNTELQLARIQAAQEQVVKTGLDSITYYFNSLSDLNASLVKQAEAANTAVSQTLGVIGRLNSFNTAFSTSANAAGSMGFFGMDEATIGRVNNASFIAAAAALASSVLTTQDAARVASDLAKDQAFTGLKSSELRDISLMLDGLKQYDASSFENSFIKMSDALAKGTINQDQYLALFGEGIKIFLDGTKETVDAFADLRNAAKSLADGLMLGDSSSLSPTMKAMEAERQYREALDLANTGDISKLASATENYLQILRDSTASAENYDRVFAGVISDVRNVENYQPSQTTKTTDDLVETINGLREELRISGATSASNQVKLQRLLEQLSDAGEALNVKIVT